MAGTIIYKTCTKCGKDKRVAVFAKCTSNPDGLQNWCKLCQRQYYLKKRVSTAPPVRYKIYKKRANG